jgi:3-oxoacyl-[acyl-carrier-protein] synthase II
MNTHDVWITGMGIVSALGAGVQNHLDAVVDSRSGLFPHPFFEGKYRTEFMSGMVPHNAFPYSIEESAAFRANSLCDIACKEALSQAGVHGTCAAEIIIGTTASNFHGATEYYRHKRFGQSPNINLVSGFLPAAPADYCAGENRLTGRRTTLSSACASGATALGHAFGTIRSGRAAMVCAGGVEALCPFIIAGFNSLRLLSKRRCRPFDAARDGFNPGEGAAMMILESAASARARGAVPLAVIKGFGMALEAFHHTRSNPDGSGIARGMRQALSQSQCGALMVDHVHLHGTSTVINDLSEYNGMKTVFGEAMNAVPVCSTKSMTGHTLGAAGAVSAVFAVLSMQQSIVPATLFHETLDPQFAGLNVLKAPLAKECNRVMTTSLGFGGEVASLLFEKAQA